MKHAFVFLIACSFLPVYGQIPTFQKNYNLTDFNSSETAQDITAAQDGFLIESITKCEDSINVIHSCSGFLKVDLSGNMEWVKKYSAYPYAFQITEIRAMAGGEYIAAGHTGSDSGWVQHVMKLDEFGDTLWYRQFYDSTKSGTSDVRVLDNGKILLQGWGSLAQYYQHLWIMQLDENGEKEWETIVDTGSPQYIGGGFSVLPNGDLAFGHKSSPIQNWDETLALTRTDSLGNALWTKTYQTNINSWCSAELTLLHNGGFALSYCRDGWPEVNQILREVYGLDSVGEIVWKYTFPPEYWGIKALNKTANGDIIGCGYRDLDFWHGWLFRLSPAGELLWQRSYVPDTPIEDNPSFFNDLTESPDGGIAAVGITADTFPGGGITSDVWLLKVDSDGCFTPGCTDTILTVSVERKGGVVEASRQVFFRVSPNPVGGQAQVSFLVQVVPGARLRVFSGQGVQVMETELAPGIQSTAMDFSKLPPGLYSVVLEAEGRILQAEKIVKL